MGNDDIERIVRNETAINLDSRDLLGELAAAKAENQRLRRALKDCIESLEYVDKAHPGTTGYGVREQRIAAARKALEG
jgi:hypothetical protein